MPDNKEASGAQPLFISVLMLVVCGLVIFSFVSYLSRGFSDKPVTMLDDCLVTSQFVDDRNTKKHNRQEDIITTMYTSCGSFLITSESKTELQTGLTYDLQVRDGVLIDGTLILDTTPTPTPTPTPSQVSDIPLWNYPTPGAPAPLQ